MQIIRGGIFLINQIGKCINLYEMVFEKTFYSQVNKEIDILKSNSDLSIQKFADEAGV